VADGGGMVVYGAPFPAGPDGADHRVPGSGDPVARSMIQRLHAQIVQFRAGQCTQAVLVATVRMASQISLPTLSAPVASSLSNALRAARDALGQPSGTQVVAGAAGVSLGMVAVVLAAVWLLLRGK
jgi:hypothetical protein